MKILIISHNPITTYQSMGKTFLSLFSAFYKEELCQLYVYPTVPDIDVCDSYFRITDVDVMKSYFLCGKVASQVIDKSQIDSNKHEFFENAEDAEHYKKKKTVGRMLIRDLMWKFSAWWNKELVGWIEQQKPTCVFVAPGDAKFLYDIALKISSKWNLPIYTYICDEYYFRNMSSKFLERIQQKMLSRKIEKLMAKTTGVISICDELKDAYGKHFNRPAYVTMTGTNYPIRERAERKEAVSMTYLGNLALKRYVTLAQIGRALDAINRETGSCYSLRIHTKTVSQEAQQEFEGIESVKFCEYVTGSEFDHTLHSADLLVHTESFDANMMDRVKHSVSTKIADSLGSGVCLVAYGSESLASISYLKNNECAFVISDETDLKERLMEILTDGALRSRLAERGLEVARWNHDALRNAAYLKEIISAGTGKAGLFGIDKIKRKEGN